MDPQRFRDAYERLQFLDERMTYRIRRHNRGPMRNPGLETVDESLKDLGEYVVELKDIVSELFLSIGGKPAGGGG